MFSFSGCFGKFRSITHLLKKSAPVYVTPILKCVVRLHMPLLHYKKRLEIMKHKRLYQTQNIKKNEKYSSGNENRIVLE